MIVVLVIGVLLAIAAPNYLRTRSISQQKTCISNLRMLDQAKEQYIYDQSLRTGDAVDASVAWTNYAKGDFPPCPAGGTYAIGNVGVPPTCSLNGAPHFHEQ